MGPGWAGDWITEVRAFYAWTPGSFHLPVIQDEMHWGLSFPSQLSCSSFCHMNL